MNKLMKKKKKGFTLIELIAVIAILAVLAVVAVPRVITYVDKSKKVAVQTEASTIYNAAEAAYNDGKLTQETSVAGQKLNTAVKGADAFDSLKVQDVLKVLDNEKLLNNENTAKFGTLLDNMTLSNLKTIMNTNVNSLDVNSQGVLESIPGAQK